MKYVTKIRNWNNTRYVMIRNEEITGLQLILGSGLQKKKHITPDGILSGVLVFSDF